jgi:ATP-dependent 26S proteasome regulatory subunit
MCGLVACVVCRVERNKYKIEIPLPPKIDPTVTMMQVRMHPILR